ncbi:MAG: hypothetical protein COU35_03940 [Candidatus Magasanikbacteria bacterium CG10_big_fil_rev_8_21_14_0_10_47_10]|uniref:Capsule polysaccharide biosynthesis protein n=1 Tax=Candidatus Magasanikbacteria bacterium CG10_big_fil_rev_8_21_14_0_10_47_10 TaxID=1974652 RepID=A0A2H0TPV7_9BACT|nr:MAG: hypothetical protein COU35_03940 [Candidatus Magasanikbacteria bacterium CG10_big_fil_rev_8_21_14_0_10_47_10]
MSEARQQNEFQGKRIILFQQRGWGKGIGRFLARKLYENGAVLAALTFKNTTHDLIVNQPDAKYELIINNDEIMSRPKDYLAGDRYSLEEICDALGIDSIWPVVSTLRNHVKCYKDKYYYSFRQNVSDEEIIDFVMAVYKYSKQFFETFKPDLIIAPNFVSLPHIMFNLYAHRQGVPMMAVTDSKIKGYFLFTYNHFDDEGPFYDYVDQLREGKIRSPRLDKAKEYIAEFRKEFKVPDYQIPVLKGKKTPLKQWLRTEISPYYQIVKWYTKKQVNELESTGITVDYRPPVIKLRDHYAPKIYTRKMQTREYYPLEKAGAFVYFPLQFQPEATIDVMAPYFSNQIETARQVAMSLPKDYTLVVKEHPGMVGFRPPSYIEKVARTVNVKLVDYRIPNDSILQKMDMIISPNSTSIAEAAFYNKPAIQLGNLGTTKKLPNVFVHHDMTTLAAKILEVLKKDFKNEKYERALEQYVAAVLGTGHEYNYFKAWERGGESMEALWTIYKKEIMKNVIFKS